MRARSTARSSREIPLALQSKLLRVHQEGQYEAAELLGMKATTVVSRIEQLGLERRTSR